MIHIYTLSYRVNMDGSMIIFGIAFLFCVFVLIAGRMKKDDNNGPDSQQIEKPTSNHKNARSYQATAINLTNYFLAASNSFSNFGNEAVYLYVALYAQYLKYIHNNTISYNDLVDMAIKCEEDSDSIAGMLFIATILSRALIITLKNDNTGVEESINNVSKYQEEILFGIMQTLKKNNPISTGAIIYIRWQIHLTNSQN